MVKISVNKTRSNRYDLFYLQAAFANCKMIYTIKKADTFIVDISVKEIIMWKYGRLNCI